MLCCKQLNLLVDLESKIVEKRLKLRNSLLISLIAGNSALETSAIRAGSSASHGLSPGIFSTQRSADISGGWRPRARSLARNVRAPCKEGRDFRRRSQLNEFSISEILGLEGHRPVAFARRPVRTPSCRSGNASRKARVSSGSVVRSVRDQAWHPSGDGTAAVDAHRRAGREGRRSEEQHRIGDIFRLTDTARRQALRRAREHRLTLVIGHAGPERRGDEAGRREVTLPWLS